MRGRTDRKQRYPRPLVPKHPTIRHTSETEISFDRGEAIYDFHMEGRGVDNNLERLQCINSGRISRISNNLADVI